MNISILLYNNYIYTTMFVTPMVLRKTPLFMVPVEGTVHIWYTNILYLPFPLDPCQSSPYVSTTLLQATGDWTILLTEHSYLVVKNM